MANSDCISDLPALAPKMATTKSMISGITLNLVNKPSIKNILQNTSANSASSNENREPIPKKL